MHHNLKSVSLFTAVIILLTFSSCAWKNPDKILYPTLLERSSLSQPEEFNAMKKLYAKYITQLEKHPDDDQTKIKLIELYITEARSGTQSSYYHEAAMGVLESLLNNTNTEAGVVYKALTYKATVLLSLHRFQEAKNTGLKSLPINSYDSDIYGVLIDAEVELGNYPSAVAFCDKMMSIRPDTRSYSRVSYLRQIMGDMPGAKQAMRMAVEAGAQGMENTEWARVQLGNLYHQTGNEDTAMMLYESAIIARSNYTPAMLGKAKVLQLEGEINEAIALMKNAITLMPESSYIAYLADLYAAVGNKEEAARARETVLNELLDAAKRNSDNPMVQHNGKREIAQAYLAVENYPKALEYARKDWEERKRNIDANALLAKVYFYQKEYAKAWQHMQVALSTHVNHPEWLTLASQIKQAMGNTIPSKAS